MKKVLIVDDQDTMRKMLHLTLAGQYELLEASDGAMAWDAVRRYRPDAVILDIMMPGEMDGYQLCERMRAESALRGIYVVMVTARGQEADHRKGIEAGANAYVVKPFSPLMLARSLDEALAGRGGQWR
jgi:DNA-binding response OmpR family regulator